MRLIPGISALGRRATNHPSGSLSDLGGSMTALVTPFRDGLVDGEVLATLCERQIRGGTAALVVCGRFGEAAALSPAEQARVVAIAVDAASNRVPVIAGCSAPATEAATALAAAAARNGAAALLCGGELIQFSGGDATAPAYRAMGGHGCILVTVNLAPALCAEMHAAWDQVDLIESARIRDLLAPLHRALFLESNPVPVKAALCAMDLCNGDLRLPLTRACSSTFDALSLLLPGAIKAEDAAAGLPRPILVT